MKAPCCLIGPNRREEYSQAVLSWLDQILPLYSPANFEFAYRNGCWPTALNNQPAAFCWDSGDYRVVISPPQPDRLLADKKGDYAAARRRLFEIALRLLEQARPCDQRALRQRMKDEGMHR